ncbi:MAG: hypothetical protein JXR32_07420 [Anaerolineaceae bacterium]|nr:hypothetical protein [Anaerolineaceae bacterium]
MTKYNPFKDFRLSRVIHGRIKFTASSNRGVYQPSLLTVPAYRKIIAAGVFLKPYTGKVLWADLTQGPFSEETIPDENPGFHDGLVERCWPPVYRAWMVVGKSPLTATWGDANCAATLAWSSNRAVMTASWSGVSARNRCMCSSTTMHRN